MSIHILLTKQNPDGGWPYARGKSWTEPSVYAALALHAAGEHRAAERGVQWIRGTVRRDGGWAPQPGVDQSSWVTGLVALLPPELLGSALHEQAIRWLTSTAGRETTPVHRVREWLRGIPHPPEQDHPGWPWTPGAAAWVGPTSIAILALEKANARAASPAAVRRVREGREYLLARMCKGGGWNHGAAKALGYDGQPYPETTGMALTALRGVKSEKLEPAMEAATRFLSDCRSADAANWLRLAMLAHGRLPAGAACPPAASRTLSEASLGVLVAAAEKGKNVFWGANS